MQQRHLKHLRVAFAILYLLFFFIIFVDFRNLFPVALIKGVTYLQFLPSIFKTIYAATLFSTGFIVVVVLTYLFGRVYCSVICPLGIIQDIFIRIKGFFKKNVFHYKKPLFKLHFSVLAIALLSLFLTKILLFVILDPYAISGRLFSDVARAIMIKANNFIVTTFDTGVSTFIYLIEEPPFNFAVFSFTMLLLLIVFIFSVLRGRLYCNSICPVGAILALISKKSLFKFRINTTSCDGCGKCIRNCKAECINVPGKEIDMLRCIACFNCLNVCPHDSISFSRNNFFREIIPSRREFISKSATAIGGLVAVPALAAEAGKPGNTFPVTPPGAVGLQHYISSCVACHLCVGQCPMQVLQPSFLEYGMRGFMVPKMDYHFSYCAYECTRCSDVCPSGAIVPLTIDKKKRIQTGMVRFIKEKCVVEEKGKDCAACAEHCPTQAVHMVPYKDGLVIPEITEETCTGCGACEYACPTQPNKAIYVIAHEIHKEAKLPEIKNLNMQVPDEFPF